MRQSRLLTQKHVNVNINFTEHYGSVMGLDDLEGLSQPYDSMKYW